MLPDFPGLKGNIKKRHMEILRRAYIDASPLLSKAHRFRQHEGNRCTYETEDGKIEKLHYKKIEARIKIPFSDVPRMGLDQIKGKLIRMAQEMTQKSMGIFLTALDQVTKETGNVIDAGGKPLTPDLLLDNLEQIHIEFDDNGNPYMPAMFINPKTFEKYKDKLKEWDKDLELIKRLEKIIQKKREEWRDRESYRKLVD